MKKYFLLAIAIIAFANLWASPEKWKDKKEKAVYGLIERVTPGYGSSFVLHLTERKAGEPQSFSYSTHKGKILLEGNTTVALSVAYYQYLR